MLVEHLLHLHLLLSSFLNGLLELLYHASAMFPLAAQIVKCFVILTAGGPHRIPQHVRVLIEIVLVLEFFERAGWLDAIARTHLLVLVLSIDAFFLFLDDVLTNIRYSTDQVHIVGHDLQVVSLVDLTFDLEALLKRRHRVLQELPLVLVLLGDVGVDVPILGLLVLDEVEEALVHSDLQLLVVVSVLDYLVDCVLEVVDDGVVVADDVPVSLNALLNETLAHAKVLNHEAETGIDSIEVPQSLVH